MKKNLLEKFKSSVENLTMSIDEDLDELTCESEQNAPKQKKDLAEAYFKIASIIHLIQKIEKLNQDQEITEENDQDILESFIQNCASKKKNE
ncbi:MAG: hypothetical protein SFT93_06070 [Rickettsiaceae bacterium]|nr:hypothetical protein [Rickettsiaceae bacterium]